MEEQATLGVVIQPKKIAGPPGFLCNNPPSGHRMAETMTDCF